MLPKKRGEEKKKRSMHMNCSRYPEKNDNEQVQCPIYTKERIFS
jgi:hypothetical protein